MNIKILATIFLLVSFTNAFAAIGKVTISSPSKGATFGPYDKIVLNYDAIPGTDGDHLHLNVDDKRVDIIRNMKGTAEVNKLSSGKHHICLIVNTKDHVPTGAQNCVDVMVK